MADDAVVKVEALTKRYGLPLIPNMRRAWHKMRHGPDAEMVDQRYPWALKDINFEVHEGETFGIIGRNGSGKSTLLKVLSGVTPPTYGNVSVAGSIFPMIELNAGVHMELTGRENIHLLGAVLGLTPAQIQSRMAAIEDFCELDFWLDRPVRMYSSGMMVRLGFGVGVNVDADILLMDEVMAVGDLSFHNKCLRYLEELRGRGKCTLFVSHNMNRIRRMCDRVLVLDQGEALYVGPTEEGVAVYEEVIQKRIHKNVSGGRAMFDYIGISLEDAAFEGEEDGGLLIGQGEDAILNLTLKVRQPVDKATVNVVMENVDALNVIWENFHFDQLEPGLHHFKLAWRDLRLKPGSYALRVGVSMGSMDGKGFRAIGIARLDVKGDVVVRGIYRPACETLHQFAEESAG
ncbi:ABC transporter ATP-binding protein [Magnetococcus sp. PR-3]|uniref:ABC transporter ATP-binding protein n=1 Tax=Magnetococcus sp. PR-3 TaxID=3120355 RepID=UPI002FCE47E6